MPEVLASAFFGSLLHLMLGVAINYVSIFCFDNYDYKFGPEGTFELANIVIMVLSGVFFFLFLVVGGIVLPFSADKFRVIDC